MKNEYGINMTQFRNNIQRGLLANTETQNSLTIGYAAQYVDHMEHQYASLSEMKAFHGISI